MARGKVYQDRDQVKEAVIRVRLTPRQRAELETQAEREGKTVSDLARERLGLVASADAAPAPAGN